VTTRRTLRARLLSTVVLAVAVMLAATLIVFNIVLAWEMDGQADEVLRARAGSEIASITVQDGVIRPGTGDGRNLETRAWVFQGTTPVQSPQVDPALASAAAELAAGPGGSTDVAGQSTRLLAVPVTSGGERIGTVVAGVSLAPYERILRRSLLGSIVLAFALLAGVAIVAGLLLRATLRPVSRMTRDAAAWSDRDLDKRFALGRPHDEITELAATLDGLLDRLAAGMRHERHLTAEISHELRTPLAQMRAEVDLALRRPRADEEYRASLRAIGDGISRIDETIDTLMTAARTEGGLPQGTAAAHAIARRAVDTCAHLAAEHGVRLGVTPGDASLLAGVSADVAARILQPVVENACLHAATTIEVGADRVNGTVEIRVVDDGPGVDPGEIDQIFDSGRRGTSARGREGAGLGLALARRLARAAGGDVTVSEGPGGRFTVRLPAA
jgi:two-component system, OmpR family, sensor kinase